MGYALLGLAIGVLLGLGSGNPAAIAGLAAIGFTMGLAVGRRRKEMRREAAQLSETRSRAALVQASIRAHLVGAAER
ncbi:MAG: hypothetical protein MUP76_01310, partial [Acidimicrobiia bacterium]|nr:hypothetical protein [Acidimicrobiia bacterium]